MSNEPPILDYKTQPPASRRWGLSRPVWLLVAGFCAVAHFGGEFATNGRISGWGDIAYISVLATLGFIAIVNAIRP